MSREALLEVAVRAARRAGDLIRAALGRDPAELALENKGAVNLVTAVDHAAEAAILEVLHGAYPDHPVLAEESGGETGTSGLAWVVDPLDGTTNFAHGHPQVAVSIAALEDGVPIVGVVLEAARGELFTAVAGGGARLDGRPLRVSAVDILDRSLLSTGFAYDRRQRSHAYVPIFESMMVASQGVRRLGCAALDLAWLAAGRYDGHWEYGLAAWDVAAGVLLVTEAGGLVTDYTGAPFDVLRPTRLLASNGRIHDEMRTVLARHRELWAS